MKISTQIEVQKIEPKTMFKTPMAPPPPPGSTGTLQLKTTYKEEPKSQIRKLNAKNHQKPTHLIMHTQMDSGSGSKGQSKLGKGSKFLFLVVFEELLIILEVDIGFDKPFA